MDPSLEAFFEALAPYLVRGEGDLERIEAALGPSPSGRARLALYPRLVLDQHRVALEGLLPATRRALEAARPGSFRRLVERHLEKNRCRGVHPSALAEGLAETVQAFSEEMADVPWLEELADLELLLGWMASAPGLSAPGLSREASALPPSPAVRWYRYDVHAYVRKGQSGTPVARDNGLILGRDRSHQLRWVRATPPSLVALGLAKGELSADEVNALGLPMEAIRAAHADLARRGLLDGVAPTIFTRRAPAEPPAYPSSR